MARFEITLVTGEKILVDHSSTDVEAILSELKANAFVGYSEVKAGSAGPVQKVIVSSSQIMLVRLMDGLSTQSSSFRPKR